MGIKGMNPVSTVMLGVGSLFGLWAFAALIGGLHRVNWQVTELMRHWLVASGMIRPIHTMVDFYTHIKGIEYIICVMFFAVILVFFQYVDRRKTNITAPAGQNKTKGYLE